MDINEKVRRMIKGYMANVSACVARDRMEKENGKKER